MLPLCISVLGGDVLSFYVAKLAQSQPNCLETGGLTSCDRPPIDTLSEGLSSAAAPTQNSYGQRAWRKAQGQLFFYSLVSRLSTLVTHPSSYLMTFSARMSTIGGIVKPSALAVFKLIISSNFVGCSTGRSAGLAPFRILSTKTAARL